MVVDVMAEDGKVFTKVVNRGTTVVCELRLPPPPRRMYFFRILRILVTDDGECGGEIVLVVVKLSRRLRLIKICVKLMNLTGRIFESPDDDRFDDVGGATNSDRIGCLNNDARSGSSSSCIISISSETVDKSSNDMTIVLSAVLLLSLAMANLDNGDVM